jgi:hypothetical protein
MPAPPAGNRRARAVLPGRIIALTTCLAALVAGPAAQAERVCTAFETDPVFHTGMTRLGADDQGPARATLEAFLAAGAAGDTETLLSLFDAADGSRGRKAASLERGETRVDMSGPPLSDPTVRDLWKWGDVYFFQVTYQVGARSFPLQEAIRCSDAGCAMSVANSVMWDPAGLAMGVHQWRSAVGCPSEGYRTIAFGPAGSPSTDDPLLFYLPDGFFDLAALRRALTAPETIGAAPPGGSLAGLTLPDSLAACMARLQKLDAQQPWQLMSAAEPPGAALQGILDDCAREVIPGTCMPYGDLAPGMDAAQGAEPARAVSEIAFHMQDAPVILPLAAYADRAHRVVMIYVQAASPTARVRHALYLLPSTETDSGPRLDGDYRDWNRAALMGLLLSPETAQHIRSR